MINKYDSEAILKVYRMINKRCDLMDKFIENNAYYFGATTDEFGSVDLINNIVDLIERKNRLINFKIIIDDAISKLKIEDRKMALIKMNYNISVNELCGILKIKERTAFRRIERVYEVLADLLNKCKYVNKLEKILDSEDWLVRARQQVKERRQAFTHQVENTL